jgi:ribosomal protein L10
MVHEIDPKTLVSKPQQPVEVLNIDQLVKYGKVEKQVEPIKGWKITMHALSQEEREQLGKLVPDSDVTTIYSRGEATKRPTLAWAITKINDDVFESLEQKQTLLEKLKAAPGTTLDLIFMEYQNLYLEQFDLLQNGIKKKL